MPDPAALPDRASPSPSAASPDALDRLRPRLSVALREAMRARDAVATSALRALLSALDHATAVALPVGTAAGPDRGALAATETPRRRLTDTDVAAIVAAEHAERQRAEAEYVRLGRPDEAARMTAEAAVLAPWLGPQPGQVAAGA